MQDPQEIILCDVQADTSSSPVSILRAPPFGRATSGQRGPSKQLEVDPTLPKPSGSTMKRTDSPTPISAFFFSTSRSRASQGYYVNRIVASTIAAWDYVEDGEGTELRRVYYHQCDFQKHKKRA